MFCAGIEIIRRRSRRVIRTLAVAVANPSGGTFGFRSANGRLDRSGVMHSLRARAGKTPEIRILR